MFDYVLWGQDSLLSNPFNLTDLSEINEFMT